VSSSVATTDVAGLRALVRLELRRAFRPPYEAPIVVAINGALMVGAWLLLPVHLQQALFRVHGPFAFPIVLGSWMYADVPSTNVLGGDAPQTLVTLGDPLRFRRLLQARALMLWTIITPICVAVAIGIGIYDGNWATTTLAIIEVVIVPLGALAVVAWIGIRFPYHPIPLAERWHDRRPVKHKLIRWGVLIVIPYLVVPFVAALIAVPTLAIWAASRRGLTFPPTGPVLLLATALAVVEAIVFIIVGHRVSERLRCTRETELREYLADPARG
jgi:hypothetical protein